MNTHFSFTREMQLFMITVAISMFVSVACSSSTPPSKAVLRPTTAEAVPAENSKPVNNSPATSVKEIADDIATDVGKVMQSVIGKPECTLFIFEETHVSPAGQVEIAIMMNRLYEDYGLRQIGLEGYFKGDGKLDSSWFQTPPPFTAHQPIREREDVIVQMLQDGEISSSEMMALTYNDMMVSGIEIPEEYNYELPENASYATMNYLIRIAAPGMNSSEIAKANELINAKKDSEAIEYIISTDDWTSKEYALISDNTKIISSEDWIQILDDLTAKASETNAEITAEDKQAMQDLRKFYELRSQSSRTMVANTLAICAKSPSTPVAMVAGAAHSALVEKLLTEKGVSFAVIRGNSLADNAENGDLSSQAYDRKNHQLSIDPPGGLGSLLDRRKKPSPVINKTWFQSKAEIIFVTDKIARAAAGGKKPPFDDVLNNITDLKGIRIDKSSIKVVGGDVIFSVEAKDDQDKEITVWVRTRVDKEAVSQLLEQRLLSGYSIVKSKDKPSNEPEKTTSEAELIPISSQSIAIFSTSKAIIESTDI